MSKEYEAALAKSDAAFAIYQKVLDDYRARRIGDDEYLEARAVYMRARADFDAAFAAEEERG